MAPSLSILAILTSLSLCRRRRGMTLWDLPRFQWFEVVEIVVDLGQFIIDKILIKLSMICTRVPGTIARP